MTDSTRQTQPGSTYCGEMSFESSIILIGFMGTGKSSVGRLLERQLGWPRYDTDELVAKEFALPVSEIFARYGEERFRAAEAKILRELNPGRPAVVVTGGGMVLRAENAQRLRELGTTVWLTADLPTLHERLARRRNRPLLQTADPQATVAALLEERRKFYEDAADFIVDTSGLDHAQVAQAIRDGIELRRGT